MNMAINGNRAARALLIAASLLCFLPPTALAQSSDTLVPVISLLLDGDSNGETTVETSCEFSITNVSPAPNSTIALNNSVSVDFDYAFRNRPEGVRMQVSPTLITSLEDLDNFQNTFSLALNPQQSTLVDFDSTESNISGNLTFERTNDGTNIGLTSRTFNDLVVFVTLSRRNSEIGGITIIGSNTFECANRNSTVVNWTFTRQPPPLQ